MRPALIIFIKNPQTQPVKTRLAATIGRSQATAFYLDCLTHIRDRLLPNLTTSFAIFLAVCQDGDQQWAQSFFDPGGDIQGIIVQKGTDIGERMLHADNHIRDLGYIETVLRF